MSQSQNFYPQTLTRRELRLLLTHNVKAQRAIGRLTFTSPQEICWWRWGQYSSSVRREVENSAWEVFNFFPSLDSPRGKTHLQKHSTQKQKRNGMKFNKSHMVAWGWNSLQCVCTLSRIQCVSHCHTFSYTWGMRGGGVTPTYTHPLSFPLSFSIYIIVSPSCPEFTTAINGLF